MGVPHGETDWPWRLPLSRRRGPRAGELVAYALLDEPDLHLVASDHWGLTPNGYAWRGDESLHRVLMNLRRGDPRLVDHVNRDRLDNRRHNLRLVTPAGSAQNRRAIGASRFRGVSWHPYGSWTAVATVRGTSHKLGGFLDETIAAVAAEAFRADHMPLAAPTPELDPFRAGIAAGALTCVRCGDTQCVRSCRYWSVIASTIVCQRCTGYTPPKRGPKFLPPRPCSNCGSLTTHLKRGRCDTCYAYLRRNEVDRAVAGVV